MVGGFGGPHWDQYNLEALTEFYVHVLKDQDQEGIAKLNTKELVERFADLVKKLLEEDKDELSAANLGSEKALELALNIHLRKHVKGTAKKQLSNDSKEVEKWSQK